LEKLGDFEYNKDYLEDKHAVEKGAYELESGSIYIG